MIREPAPAALRRSRRQCPVQPDEGGAVLVLALVFLLIGGLILSALVSLSGTNLLATQNLQSQRNREFAADAAVEGAIETLRHQAPSSLTNPVCPSFPSAGTSVMVNGSRVYVLTIDGVTVAVNCEMGIPQQYYGRITEFDACDPTAATSFSSCQSAAIVRANVIFNDVAPGCTSGAMSGCYGSSWGTGLTVQSWVVESVNS